MPPEDFQLSRQIQCDIGGVRDAQDRGHHRKQPGHSLHGVGLTGMSCTPQPSCLHPPPGPGVEPHFCSSSSAMLYKQPPRLQAEPSLPAAPVGTGSTCACLYRGRNPGAGLLWEQDQSLGTRLLSSWISTRPRKC